MRTIDPHTSDLRRLHAVNTSILQQYIHNPPTEPVKILDYKLPSGRYVKVVSDGTHRMQAALERGDTSIEYEKVTLHEVEREARARGYDIHDLIHRSRPFELGVYDHY